MGLGQRSGRGASCLTLMPVWCAWVEPKELIAIFAFDFGVLTHIEPRFWVPKRTATPITGHAAGLYDQSGALSFTWV